MAIKNLLVSIVVGISFLFTGCAILKPAITTIKEDPKSYKYFYISATPSLSSSTGGSVNGIYFSSGKTVNPSDVITGFLTKEGFIKIVDLKPINEYETLIVNYGESGRRGTGLGSYTIEVTIQFINAKTNDLVCSCTAEGQGETETDDIRKAINRCLNALFPKK